MIMKTSSSAALFSVLCCFFFAGCGDQAGSGSRAKAATPPDSVDGTVQHVVDGLLQHEPQRVWASLPASYQSDVSGLIAAFADKVDRDIYDRGFVLLERLGKLLENKKELFLASQMLPDMVDREEAAAHWDAFADMVKTLATSDLARVETLASLDVEKFLATTGASLMANAERVATAAGEDLFEELRGLRIEVVEAEGDQAIVRIAGKDTSEDLEMTRVEGRWVPLEMAEDWSEVVASARKEIESISARDVQALKPQILGAYGLVEGTLLQMEAAQTTEQLDEALQGIVFAVMGLMMGSALGGMEFELN